MKVPEAVPQLLQIVDRLHEAYPHKKFTLDGRLVGDLGEVLVEQAYEVKLFPGLEKWHDASTPDGKRVQIKATMQASLTFPVGHTPDYYIGIQIQPDGTFKEVFNGPGLIAAKAVENRKPPKNNLHSISIGKLAELDKEVAPGQRIPKRQPEQVSPAAGVIDG